MPGYDRAPGYVGYHRRFEKEYVSVYKQPQSKYSGVAPNHRALGQDTMYQSIYSQDHGAHSRALVGKKKETLTRTLGFSGSFVLAPTHQSMANKGAKVLAGKGISTRPSDARGKEIQRVKEAAFTHRPTNWGTTYRDRFDGQKTQAVFRNIAPDTFGASHSEKTRDLDLDEKKVVHYRDSFRYGQIRRERPTTTYGRDFADSATPAARFFGTRDVKRAVSAHGTSRELFSGTTKSYSQSGASRLPGYSGHIPKSQANHGNLVLDQFPTLKDNLREVYRHDMPGYTGHISKSVINDSGPRDPDSLKDVHNGRLQVSLVLESMGGKIGGRN